MNPQIDTIIFDLGGVLVDWSPENIYRTIFKGDTAKMNWFLTHVCSPEWNLEQDAGRSIAEGEAIKIAEFPAYEKEIKAFYKDWEHMFVGPIQKNVALFHKLKATKKYKIYALTNWNAEKWDISLQLFPFFKDFDGVVVSGQEKCRKPSEKIFEIIFNKFKITPEKTVFIDDNLENIVASKSVGLNGILFKDSEQLISDLEHLNISY